MSASFVLAGLQHPTYLLEIPVRHVGIIQQVGDGYRFRFKRKGSLGAEQWLTPTPDPMAAHTSTRIRKFGMTVATTEGTVRKLTS
jgi:hypothetical protein